MLELDMQHFMGQDTPDLTLRQSGNPVGIEKDVVTVGGHSFTPAVNGRIFDGQPHDRRGQKRLTQRKRDSRFKNAVYNLSWR